MKADLHAAYNAEVLTPSLQYLQGTKLNQSGKNPSPSTKLVESGKNPSPSKGEAYSRLLGHCEILSALPKQQRAAHLSGLSTSDLSFEAQAEVHAGYLIALTPEDKALYLATLPVEMRVLAQEIFAEAKLTSAFEELDGSKGKDIPDTDRNRMTVSILNEQGEGQDRDKYKVGTWEFNEEDGSKYNGPWRKVKRHGNGTAIWPDGSSYEGDWYGDIKHGHGKFTWVRENLVYEGHWNDDQEHGPGKITWEGGTYDGQWIKGKRTGHAIITWTEGGHRYEGQVVDGIRQGEGYCTFGDGSAYEGQWENGLRHGNGRAAFPKSKEWPEGYIKEGTWMGGVYQEPPRSDLDIP